MAEREELMRLQSVEKRYGSESVLRVNDLALWQGETVIATGRNGSGKSTLGKIIAGSVAPSQGFVRRSPVLLQGSLGLLPQHGGLYGELSVEQNLLLRCHLFGVPVARASDLQFLEPLGVTGVLHKRYTELSGGFQRLVSLALVLSLRPSWLVLDEPLTGLDAEKRQAVVAALDQARGSVRLCVIITPNPEELPYWGRHIEVEGGLVSCASL